MPEELGSGCKNMSFKEKKGKKQLRTGFGGQEEAQVGKKKESSSMDYWNGWGRFTLPKKKKGEETSRKKWCPTRRHGGTG